MKLSLDRLSRNSNPNKISPDELIIALNKFQHLFQLTDLVFANLRILCPSRDEIKKTEESIRMFENKWRIMELSEPPKIHLLFVHTMNQVKEFGGIADMAEDFVEKAHQEGKKLDHLVARINTQSYRQQELMKIRRKWLVSDPEVRNQIVVVTASNKRQAVSTRENKADLKRKIKLEKRQKVQENHSI